MWEAKQPLSVSAHLRLSVAGAGVSLCSPPRMSHAYQFPELGRHQDQLHPILEPEGRSSDDPRFTWQSLPVFKTSSS
jgi:hypothetical protein